MFNRFLILVSLTFFSLGVVACGTMEGAGRDVEDAGEAIQDAAD